MKQSVVIAFKEFRDRLCSGWVVACALVWLGAIGLTSLFGLVQMGRIDVQGYERTTLSLLNLVQYLVPLLALLVGHDLIVREREDKTLNLILASGISRARVLFAKFLGGCFTIALPLILGFVLAGIIIGFAASDKAFAPFARLAISGLALGIVFCAVGLLISTVCRSRIQALVLALLAWCTAVFVFDLVALGVIVSTKSVHAAQEIELICDATHVNNLADIHNAFDTTTAGAKNRPSRPQRSAALGVLWLNPVDVFRLINLPDALDLAKPAGAAGLSMLVWLAFTLGVGTWRLRKIDL
jgi:Cu-processing system permease protein